jgi:hypothetical protein
MVTKYKGDDWNMQLLKPKARKIIGKPVTFAYPFDFGIRSYYRN